MKRRHEEGLRERRMKEMKEELVASQRSLQAALLERDARKNQLVTRIKEGKVCPKHPRIDTFFFMRRRLNCKIG